MLGQTDHAIRLTERFAAYVADTRTTVQIGRLKIDHFDERLK
jgi:hypothetical protein